MSLVGSGLKFEVKAEDNISIEIGGISGCLTGTAIYHMGNPGSYWVPPEPAEIEDIKMYVDGVLISDDSLCDEDDYINLLDAVWPIIERDFHGLDNYKID
jgi:hypothetical protein